MITSLHIQNYKCFKDFTITGLGMFNVLVGPNDSGKSAFLEAIRLVAARGPGKRVIGSELAGIPLGASAVWRKEPLDILIQANATQEGVGIVDVTFKATEMGSSFQTDFTSRKWHDGPDVPRGEQEHNAFLLSSCLGVAAHYRFDPAALREWSPAEGPMGPKGLGLPTFLDDLQRDHWDGFQALRDKFRKRFPHYEFFKIKKQRTGHGQGYVLEFQLTGGELLPDSAVSDGVMLSLAFMALHYAPDPPKILLIEEPENGVHPASLKEIVQTLRDLADNKGVQVILTTHSPYLLDLAEPEEVRVFEKDQEGAVQATRLSDFPDVEDMKKHFMTGEIWSVLGEKHKI